MSKPDYTVTKPSGSSVLLCSRNPSDDAEGIIVIGGDGEGNLNPPADNAGQPDVGGAEIGHGEVAVGAAQVAVGAEAAAAAGGAGPGERPPDSDQEDESESQDDGGVVGDVPVPGGDQPQHEPQHSHHAGHGARVRARLYQWRLTCGGQNGFCKRALCVKRRNLS